MIEFPDSVFVDINVGRTRGSLRMIVDTLDIRLVPCHTFCVNIVHKITQRLRRFGWFSGRSL